MSKIEYMSYSKTKEIVIDGITIRQDSEGRYCLNDVEKAATVGHNPRTVELHEFMRRPETLRFAENLENTGNPRIKAYITKPGRIGGTFVVKELVYAYAMWISPEYHVKVIRAYDRMVTDGIAVHENAAQDLLNNPLNCFARPVCCKRKKPRIDVTHSQSFGAVDPRLTHDQGLILDSLRNTLRTN